MGEISLPIEHLQATAQQIITDTNNLSDETALRWNQIHTSISELPWMMQEVLNGFFTPVKQNFTQILALRENIGQQLAQSSDVADTLENYIASSF